MADAILNRRSALEGHNPAGQFGALREDGPGIRLQEQAALDIIQVDAWDSHADKAKAAIEKAIGLSTPGPVSACLNDSDLRILSIGPNRWLVVEPEKRDLFSILAKHVTSDLAVLVDQGHGRVCWRLSGPRWRDLLVKGSTIDFDGSAFQPGHCVGTALGHFTVTIHCRNDLEVDIYGARSFAVDLNHWLKSSALEFGLEVLSPSA